MEVIKNGQNLLDIAIQATGDAAEALTIALANGLCLTDDLEVGQEVDVPDEITGNANVKTYYRDRRLNPATAATDDDTAILAFEGIEFWGIEYDFIVS